MTLRRETILPEPALPDASNLLDEGKLLARSWQVVPGPFLCEAGVESEAQYKRNMAERGRIMRHAHMGFREIKHSKEAWTRIYDRCSSHGVRIDRFGVTLDWSMGFPRDHRTGRMRGTGLILDRAEDFVALTHGAPAAPHFGDFVLGFPASVENTQAALAAGSTSIGNLGQYFTFRLPGENDDVASTSSTLSALALIAAQDVEVLVHSNLDDGYAAVFTDMSSVLGAALLEKHIVEDLVGAPLSHCYGHHFTDPVRRLAFHLALKEVSAQPGTMVYGNTVSYRGGHAENYASLAAYLMIDIAAQKLSPSGHAINPVPVSENERIPNEDEIVNAQCFAARLVSHAEEFVPLIDVSQACAIASEILAGGRIFKTNVLKGLDDAGIDTSNPFEMMIALRRIGGARLEQLFGAGETGENRALGRVPIVKSPLVEELDSLCAEQIGQISPEDKNRLAQLGLKVMVATTDVHEHGKLVLENALSALRVETLSGGVSIDADELADLARSKNPDVIALSTYNGVALTYMRQLKRGLSRHKLKIPVLIGGRLNQIPDGTNTSLPVDVTAQLAAEGAIVCSEIEDAVPALLAIGENPERT